MNKILIVFLGIVSVIHSVRCQNFSGGFEFYLPYNDTTSATFLPNFPKHLISSEDLIGTDGQGNFIRGNQPIRFFGVNITTEAAFPQKADAEYVAGWMREEIMNLRYMI